MTTEFRFSDTSPADAREPDSFARAAARLEQERPLRDRRLQQIAVQLRTGSARAAYDALNDCLARRPDDVDVLFLAGEASARLRYRGEAAARFARCLEHASGFTGARFALARLLLRLNRFSAALEEANRLLKEDPRNPLFLQLKANAFTVMGEDRQALAIWRQLAADNPGRAESWNRYGDALRAAGLQPDAIAAYRRAIACSSSPAPAWWSLANLKTFRFTDADVAAMLAELNRSEISAEDRVHLLFALGKAYEDQGAFGESFEHYAKANAAKRLRADKYPKVPDSRVAQTKTVFTSAFLHTRKNAGCPVPGAIFVLGQQRSGSTLIEQILSAHPAVEGTGELKYIPALARRLDEQAKAQGSDYPHILGSLKDADLSRLGEEYLADVRVHRKLDRPFFVDKNPGNYLYLGLICLILPKAKIIDARRHPAACCLSIFRQNLGTGSLRLNELAQNYRDYVALMAHFDRVLPGRVHRVIYEDLVCDPEAEIRRMLAYLELPFDEACLHFYESGRSVLTPSSEQVRRPISREAIDNWRNYEPWLKPLLDSLGSVAAVYPSVPEEFR